MSRVIVVGSVNVDLTASVDRLPAPGETLLGTGSVPLTGGKGANQASAASRLGAQVEFVAAAGGDSFGDQVCTDLAAARVDVAQVRRIDGASTGIALITVAADGENTIVVCSGANLLLDAAAGAAAGEAAGPGDVLLLQLEIPLATTVAAATAARRRAAVVVLNAAPLPAVRGSMFAELLGACDVLIVNETEAAALGACAAPSTVSGWTALARGLRAAGPATCVVTLGAQGAVVAGAHGEFHQPAFPVRPVDTTGAGDSFCATLSAGLAAGQNLPDAVRRACAAAALSTTRLGAQSALPTGAEVDAFLTEEVA